MGLDVAEFEEIDPRRPHVPLYTDRVLAAAFQAISAILCEQECYVDGDDPRLQEQNQKSGRQRWYGPPLPLLEHKTEPRIIEAVDILMRHMLRVDYDMHPAPVLYDDQETPWMHAAWALMQEFCAFFMGFIAKAKDRILPSVEDRWKVGIVFLPFSARGHAVADIAIMLYQYVTYRLPRSFLSGLGIECMPGYTGIIYEMVEEIPTRGLQRLQRRLSVDIYELIPEGFLDHEEQAVLMVGFEKLAKKYSIPLDSPGTNLLLFLWVLRGPSRL
ncbi:hypothetical protein V8F20_008916 [Naviculisporaceae sp. PSN 640]